MITAIRKVHGPKGPSVADGGYEYNLTVIAAMLTLAEVGPGRPSVDAAVFPRLKGNGWALAQFAAWAAGAALLTSERMNPREPAPDDADGVQAERQNRFVREDAEVPAR